MASDVHDLRGRQQILLPIKAEDLNPELISKVFNYCLNIHKKNVEEMELLEDYFFGKRAITERVKNIRPDIDNKVRVNYPVKIVVDLNSYFLEKPITWTSKSGSSSEDIETLSKVLKAENKDKLDMELAQNVGLYGVAYRGQFAENPRENDYPLLLSNHSPLDTFIVKSSFAGNEDLFSVNIVDELDEKELQDGNVQTVETYLIYTATEYFTLKETDNGFEIDGAAQKHHYGFIPIVEFANNQWRSGDFEMVIDLLDALDKLYSDRLNAVEQYVQSILVFINCEITDDDIESLSENLAISIKSYKGSTNQGGLDSSDVKFVTAPLNQTDTQALADEIEGYITALTGIMTRSNRPGGGQDTGEAVYLRDGGRDMETIARIKEASFSGSERKCLRIISNILSANNIVNVDHSDIEIKFTRNASNNILNKAHAISILNGTKILEPADTLSVVGISSSPVDMAKRGVAYWEAKDRLALQAENAESDKETTSRESNGEKLSFAINDEATEKDTEEDLGI